MTCGPFATSWSVARAHGLKHYFTGKLCKRSHLSVRLTSTGQCLKCLTELQKKYYQQNPEPTKDRARVYREANPEKVSANLKHWRKSNAQLIAEKKAAHYRLDVEGNRLKARMRYEQGGEQLREKSRLSAQKNKEHQSAYRKANSHAVSAWTAKRRAQKLTATPCWFNEFDELVLHEAHRLSKVRSQLTGIPWQVDHTIPLSGKWASGLHCAANTQVIPKVLNNQKSARRFLIEPNEWVMYL